MKQRNFILLALSLLFCACSSKQTYRTDTLLRQWQFTQDTTENPIWEDVTIPHDWAISGVVDLDATQSGGEVVFLDYSVGD